MLRDHAWIEGHIPHQGAMCLLDGVLDWDRIRIRCLSRAHRASANPMRSNGRLATVCGIEFAAQAMAVHGALLEVGMRQPRIGYLASVRGVEVYVERLDDIGEELIASAERIAGDQSTVLYRFSLEAAGQRLIEGRATIVLSRRSLPRDVPERRQ